MSFSRREILRLGSAALALAPWSRAADEGAFEFVALNDTHYIGGECREFHERIVRQIRATSPEVRFCLFAGDVADLADAAAYTALREIYGALGVPLAAVPGNHDHASDTDGAAYDAAFPDQRNFGFFHGGWQFLGLDTTQGLGFADTEISSVTLAFLDSPLDPHRPTFAFTHFPLAEGVEYRPRNASAALDRLLRLNLRWLHCGHWHGEHTATLRGAGLSTNRCCARLRGNRDGSPLKGWHVYRAWPDGSLTRRFVAVPA
jgi:3',5'-cyclic AMP phosphodiesterase CpdA